MFINVTHNFQKECGEKDADRYSKKLQHYHQYLWSKSLPNGQLFTLTCSSQNRLHHKSGLGEFYLSSDRAINTFSNWKKTKKIADRFPTEEINHFNSLTETIGAIMIWPSTRVNGKTTINGARGMNSKISDRLDLTIECIRRFYRDERSPLWETFRRYQKYFSLFTNFKGYVDFFLLQDAVSDNYKSVLIASPFDDFHSAPIPKTISEYRDYMRQVSEFVNARNKRIAEFCSG